MKKLSQLPSEATNHSYHKIDWNQAPNYVAKTYKTPDGSINTSSEGREACFGDIKLQYEAAHWAEEFNKSDPPKKIHIIRAYAIGEKWKIITDSDAKRKRHLIYLFIHSNNLFAAHFARLRVR